MALVKCPECGARISTEAKTCPKCGYILKKEKNFFESLISVIADMLLIFVYLFLGFMALAVIYVSYMFHWAIGLGVTLVAGFILFMILRKKKVKNIKVSKKYGRKRN